MIWLIYKVDSQIIEREIIYSYKKEIENSTL
jgi:hypothetical protein